MPKSDNQKLKLLFILDYLNSESDEDHPVNASQLIEYLAKNGIRAERKSVYSDIAALVDYGVDIESGKRGYFVAKRDFETAELKLLVDAVQSSKFITRRKTGELIKKLEKLTNRFDAASLQRQVVVQNRIKNMRESIYYSVDAIHSAISADKKIRFKYFRFNERKERVAQRGGAWYIVSPFALIWDNENYYLVGFDAQNGEIRNYRVDRMDRIELMDEEREGEELFGASDIATYTSHVFGMFSGDERTVRMRFHNELASVVIDKLGLDAFLVPDGKEYFTVTADISVSPQFYGWLAGLGTKAEIVAPWDVREKFAEFINGISELYK
ncbi:MAG: WYL domain-containing protein [Oscillospiraceae bacterium]|nr:WYL domain-containing protein [Oscillospiraceae bacterium]